MVLHYVLYRAMLLMCACELLVLTECSLFEALTILNTGW